MEHIVELSPIPNPITAVLHCTVGSKDVSGLDMTLPRLFFKEVQCATARQHPSSSLTYASLSIPPRLAFRKLILHKSTQRNRLGLLRPNFKPFVPSANPKPARSTSQAPEVTRLKFSQRTRSPTALCISCYMLSLRSPPHRLRLGLDGIPDVLQRSMVMRTDRQRLSRPEAR